MNACIDNGFAYLFYLIGVPKVLSVSMRLLAFADTAHTLSSWWAIVIQGIISIAVVFRYKNSFVFIFHILDLMMQR